VVMEPRLQYSYVSNNHISIVGFSVLPAITIGLIDVQQASRNTVTAALGLRYGFTSEVELQALLPYVYRHDSFVTRPLNVPTMSDVTSSLSGQGLGDIEAAVRYQPTWASHGRLGLIGELRVKSRTGKGPLELPLDPATGQPTELATGTGFWTVQPGVTAVLPVDPAVVYGGLRYQWNLARQYGGNIGEYDPGDGIGFNVGLGLALNEASSLSIGYDNLWLARNQQNGAAIPGSVEVLVGRLQVGYTQRLSRTSLIQFSLEAGLTDAAPDVQIGLRFPFSL